ncbi:MAG: DUF808 domain-containing protein [Acidobacteriota bacterium]|jgi:predicted DNA repair protein MutK|nr:DUF808 domain-containing protein [Acidobacteriota bacterium]
MAFASLLALLDDISTVLDDVSLMTKVAAKKTAGVVGDDLAINAQQVTGTSADREMPVVLAVARGSLVNKVILVPAALLISAFAPKLLTILLMLGGAYLCFEGVEKVVEAVHRKRHPAPAGGGAPKEGLTEKELVRGAVRTDFILSAEIITIALGEMVQRALLVQTVALAVVAVIMTIGVYGLVAGIVKLDDLGFWAMGKPSAAAKAVGKGLIAATPWLMRGLGVVGTAAMFLVGGGIIVHGIPVLDEWLHHVVGAGASVGFWVVLGRAVVGVLVGVLAVTAVKGVAGAVRLVRR